MTPIDPAQSASEDPRSPMAPPYVFGEGDEEAPELSAMHRSGPAEEGSV